MIIEENGIYFDNESDHLWITDGSNSVEIGVQEINDIIKTLEKCNRNAKTFWLVASFYQYDDSVLVYAKNLRGCHTYGNDAKHASEMIKECAIGLIESYLLRASYVPWEEWDYEPEGEWITDKNFIITLGDDFINELKESRKAT